MIRELSVTDLYLLEEDVVHDDHGRQVGVGTPHHSQLGGLRPWSGGLWSWRGGLPTLLLHQRARWVLRVRGVHGAHVFRAHICQPQADTTYNYYNNDTGRIPHWPLHYYTDFLWAIGFILNLLLLGPVTLNSDISIQDKQVSQAQVIQARLIWLHKNTFRMRTHSLRPNSGSASFEAHLLRFV